ncbi:MAG: GMC family oxidoreductase [Blastocatellia bacterium]|nr:GMC family oxidoreductase [Blastocatellia bacterium]
MLIDARTLGSEEVMETDVCIVGGGPAGITLAREMAGQDFRVCILESGGTEPDEETQALAEGATSGDCIQEPHTSRARLLGGSSHLWNSAVGKDRVGFRSGILAAGDFEKKDWVPHSGWPFGKEELDPYYERAQTICQLGPYRYDGAGWEAEGAARLPFDEDVLTTSVWQFSGQNVFTDEHRETVLDAANITTYIFANVVEIETSEDGGSVNRFRVACLDGKNFWVAAKIFVLAAGGIENARLLLVSDKKHKAGIGNENDLVGRYFMEHQVVRTGTLFPTSPKLFDRTALYDQRDVNGALVLGKIDFTDSFLQREKLLNVSAMLLPKHKWHHRVRQDSADSLAEMVRAGRRLKVPSDVGSHLKKVAGGLDYVVATTCRKASRGRLFPYFVDSPNLISPGGWSDLDNKHKRFSFFEVLLHTEQAPDPNNRVRLGDERDALGLRRVVLEWQWGEVNIESIRRAQELLAAEFARSGLGKLRIELKEGKPDMVISGLHHHMGTTRINNDPRQGVVDEHGRVHSISNLFTVGCSAFPTGGYINCTLTIVALAIRMADKLKGLIRTVPNLRSTKGVPDGKNLG